MEMQPKNDFSFLLVLILKTVSTYCGYSISKTSPLRSCIEDNQTTSDQILLNTLSDQTKNVCNTTKALKEEKLAFETYLRLNGYPEKIFKEIVYEEK